VIDRIRANPRPLLLIGLVVLILAGALAVVGPLFETGGPPQAQVAGALPSQAVAGKQFEADIAVDNIGDSALTETCVEATIKGPVTPDYAVFNNTDQEGFAHDVTCGGELGGQETVSVQVFLTATGPGTAQISFSPVESSQVLGTGITGSLTIASS
jgi:hypothetical protein